MAYTTIDDPSAYFQALVYAGTGGDGDVTQPTTHTNDGNSDLQPDLIWFKDMSATYSHYLVDSSRGRAKGLKSDTTAAETTSGQTGWDLVSFDSDGFKVGAPSEGNSTNGGTSSKVAWQWKANGGTTSSLSNTGPDSVVQVNSDAKFSIGTYTGNGSNSNVKHGLGEAPDMLIVKRRTGGTGSWAVWHKDLTTAYWLRLDTTTAQASGVWDGLNPSSEKFFITGGSSNVNISGSDYLFYAWKGVQGYSKFGKYVGNGNANGTFVNLGFKPAFLLVKRITNSGYNWRLVDSARNTFNLTDLLLMPDSNAAQFDGSTHANNIGFDFLSNGFKLRTNHSAINGNGATYIYMAFAENPVTTSTGIPTTAR